MKSALLSHQADSREGGVLASKKAASGHITDREVSKQWLEPSGWREFLNLSFSLCSPSLLNGCEGENLLAVMDAMGHQSVDTTRIYNHSNLVRIREAIERRNQQMCETMQ
jgi:hypothetical protein